MLSNCRSHNALLLFCQHLDLPFVCFIGHNLDKINGTFVCGFTKSSFRLHELKNDLHFCRFYTWSLDMCVLNKDS